MSLIVCTIIVGFFYKVSANSAVKYLLALDKMHESLCHFNTDHLKMPIICAGQGQPRGAQVQAIHLSDWKE